MNKKTMIVVAITVAVTLMASDKLKTLPVLSQLPTI